MRSNQNVDTAANIGSAGDDNASWLDGDAIVQAANVANLGNHSTTEIDTAFSRLRAAGIL